MRICKECLEEKPLEEYHKSPASKGGRKPVCKSCRNAYTREYRKYVGRSTTPEQNRKYALRSLYSISVEEYEKMYENQQGCCAVCHRPEEDVVRGRLFVDHDHATGKVRGLLCSNCNTAIGLLQDCGTIMAQAIHYLENHTQDFNEH